MATYWDLGIPHHYMLLKKKIPLAKNGQNERALKAMDAGPGRRGDAILQPLKTQREPARVTTTVA